MSSAILRAVNGVISEGCNKSGNYNWLALLEINSHLEDDRVSRSKSGGNLQGEHNLPALNA